MKHISTIVGALVVSILLACNSDKAPKESSGLPVIQSYFQPFSDEALIIDIGSPISVENNNGASIEHNYCIVFTNRINRAAPDTYKVWSYKPDGSKQPTPGFLEIAKEYNDTNSRPDSYVALNSPCCFREKIIRIDIFAADDFSPEYPTGASLNTLFSVHYDDVATFINADYDIGDDFKTKTEPLDVFNTHTGGTLMPFSLKIQMTDFPNGIKPLQHKYTIRYSFTDGNMIDKTVDKIGKVIHQ